MKQQFDRALLNLQIDWKDGVVSIDDSPEMYRQLIDLAVENQFYATVVVSRSWFDAPPPFIETHLREIVATVESPQWPGTELLEATAIVYWFRVTRRNEGVLKSVGKFWNWLHPDYPEDICLWNSNLEWVVGSVAHEKMCFMNLESQDVEKCQAILEGLTDK